MMNALAHVAPALPESAAGAVQFAALSRLGKLVAEVASVAMASAESWYACAVVSLDAPPTENPPAVESAESGTV